MATNTVQNQDGTYTTYAEGLYTPQAGSTAISSNTLTQQPSITLPPPAPIDTGAATNASIPSTIGSIVQSAYQPTATETQQSDLSKKLASLIGGEQSLATQQTNAESQAGIPGLAKSVNDLTTQLSGLNDQASKLQLDASAGGTIENKLQLGAEGRGITTGGLAPLQAGELRKNQIQQAAISSQALTVKSALYAAQGNYTLAKDAADKAAQVAFDADEQKIKGQQAQLAAIQPQLDREQSKRAAVLNAQLAERKTQIDNQREDFKTGQGLAILAMKNNPSDPQAQFAAQQALKLDPSDPQYLQKVSNLVGKYQQDPQATQQAIDQHLLAQAQLRTANLNAQKLNQEIKAGQPIVPTNANAPYINAFNSALAGVGAQAASQAKTVFSNLVNQGDLTGAKNYIVRTALANAGVDQQNQAISRTTALSALNDISSLLAQAQAKGAGTNLLTGNATKVAESLGATNNPDLSYIGSRITAVMQAYRRGMTGVAFSPAESKQYEQLFPGTTKNGDLNTAKIAALQDALNANNKAVLSYYLGDQNYDSLFPNQQTNTLPSNKTTNTTTMTGPGGTFSVPNDQVSLFKQNGYK